MFFFRYLTYILPQAPTLQLSNTHDDLFRAAKEELSSCPLSLGILDCDTPSEALSSSPLEAPSSTQSKSSRKAAYVVFHGRRIGVFYNWSVHSRTGIVPD
jgi:hypothetical protein